jgi:hypothetical protein
VMTQYSDPLLNGAVQCLTQYSTPSTYPASGCQVNSMSTYRKFYHLACADPGQTNAPVAAPVVVPSVAPTAVPSVAPTAVPSVVPTAVPSAAANSGSGSSFSTGTGSFFLVSPYYASGDCTGVPTSVMIALAGVCKLQGMNYQKIVISGDTIASVTYSDSECATQTGSNSVSTTCSSMGGTSSYQNSIATSYDLSALFGGSSDVRAT